MPTPPSTSSPLSTSPLKIVSGYPYYPSQAYDDVEQMELALYQRLRAAGFQIEGFCLTLGPPNDCLRFPELDARWRRGDRQLLAMYERLEATLDGADVFINRAGINLHPEFVEKLPVFTVFQCFDDPENSHNLSRPVASSYDLCLVGNIACVDDYREWGARRAEWIPLGLMPEIYDATLTRAQIENEPRDIDLFMMSDRLSPWRRERMDVLGKAFPDAHFYGAGWPRGFLPPSEQLAWMRRARIGPNLHNSSGPINYRTFYLPANGVMQICDNKSHLGRIYELNREVVGFDSVEECIDLCRYYMAHEDERRAIAVAGWQRALTDYNEIAVFRRAVGLIEDTMQEASARETRREHIAIPNPSRDNAQRNITHQNIAARQRRGTKRQRLKHHVRRVARLPLRVLRKIKWIIQKRLPNGSRGA